MEARFRGYCKDSLLRVRCMQLDGQDFEKKLGPLHELKDRPQFRAILDPGGVEDLFSRFQDQGGLCLVRLGYLSRQWDKPKP